MSQDDENGTPPEPQVVEETLSAEPVNPPTPGNPGQMKRLAVTVAIASLIVLALAGFYYQRTAGGEPQMSAIYKCYECGHIATLKPKVGESPDTCPSCGKATFRPAYKCPECGTPQVLNESRGLEPPTKCSKCGAEISHGE